MLISQNYENVKSSLRKRIAYYLGRARRIDDHLSRQPDDWGKFQSEFNVIVNDVFIDIMNYDKENADKGRAERTERLKQLFVKRIRKIFLRGSYNRYSLEKPYGYAGDFKIIEGIYLNAPDSRGMERLHDNYFQMSAISIAVRNRKEDFKKLIMRYCAEHPGRPLRIMNVACGPCREIVELFSAKDIDLSNVFFDCYDSETSALAYAREKLKGYEKNVSFHQLNALRLGVSKDITKLLGHSYDLIYSTGLFDYLSHKLSVRIVHNLKNALNEGGLMAIANVRDKFSNPSVFFMEWVGDWNLIYRSDEEFTSVFLDAGFQKEQLQLVYEQQGIILYIVAHNGPRARA